MNDVTRLLKQAEAGDEPARARLYELLYDQLRALARDHMARVRPGSTLQATALVHEAYLKLVGNGGECDWRSRRQFFGAAAERMRRSRTSARR